MATKRLYPFSTAIANTSVLILFAALVACGSAESDRPTVEASDEQTQATEVTDENAIDYEQYDVFLSHVVPNDDPSAGDIMQSGDYRVMLPLESTRSSQRYIFTYDQERNSFLNTLEVLQPLENPYQSHFFSYPGFYLGLPEQRRV